MTATVVRRAPLLLLVVLLLPTRPARAWNPLETVGRGARAVGRVIGAPFGGFVEGATTPTLRNVEGAGQRLVQHAGDTIGRELDHAGRVVSGVVAQTDRTLATRLDQVDQSLKARLVQVQTIADGTVDRAFGRLDASVGRLDAIAQARIAQIGRLGKDLLAQADAAAQELLARADAIMRQRTAELRELVHAAITQADVAIEARIAQIDEVAGRRIGNVDVVATKQSLGLEGMLLRIAALIGMIGFIAFVLWRLFVEAGRAWNHALAASSTPRRLAQTLLHGSPRFLVQVAMAVGGAILLYRLSDYLPRDARDRADRQIAVHRAAFASALASYDFAGVRYHAAQLELLVPQEADALRGAAGKAELLRSVFSRPARLQSGAGVRELVAEIATIERRIGNDPDLLVIKAYIQWQIGVDRSDELEAARLCADALEAPASATPGGFLLAPLADNYLRAFLHDPYVAAATDPAAAAELNRLHAVRERRRDPGVLPPLQHVLELNRLFAELDAAATAPYLAMLSAHADFRLARSRQPPRSRTESAAMRAAREARNAEAARVVDAWRRFDEALATSPWLVDDPSALRAFTLDDAVLSHARYYLAVPTAADLPPLLTAPAAATKLPPLVRVQMAPLRVAWEERYLPLVGLRARDVLAYEEAERFRRFEERDRAFERTYVEFLVTARGGKAPPGRDLAALATAAAAAAADLGLYRDTPNGRITEAAHIVEQARAGGVAFSPEQLAGHAAAYQRRRLRFL